eukprot:403340369
MDLLLMRSDTYVVTWIRTTKLQEIHSIKQQFLKNKHRLRDFLSIYEEYMGNVFLRELKGQELDIQMDECFTIVKESITTESQLTQFITRIGKEKMPPFMLQFKVYLIPNYEVDSSIVIFKSNHSLTDGVGIQMLFCDIQDSNYDNQTTPTENDANNSSKHLLDNTLDASQLPFIRFQTKKEILLKYLNLILMPYYAMRDAIISILPWNNVQLNWPSCQQMLLKQRDQQDQTQSGETSKLIYQQCINHEIDMVQLSQDFKVDELKALTRTLNCTINDLLLTIFALSLKQHLSDRGKFDPNREKRQAVNVVINQKQKPKLKSDIYYPNFLHNGKLIMPLNDDFQETLREIQKSMNKCKNSHDHYATVYFSRLLMLFLPRDGIEDTKNHIVSKQMRVNFSNIAGSTKSLKIGNSYSKDMNFKSFLNDTETMTVSVLSHCNILKFSICISQLMLSGDALRDLMQSKLLDLLSRNNLEQNELEMLDKTEQQQKTVKKEDSKFKVN